MQEIIREAASTVVQVLITVLVSMLIGVLMSLRKRITDWIDTRKDKDMRELLHKVAEEGFAYVESTFRNLKGSPKLDEAISYVNRHLRDRGIQLSTQEIQAAIEKAVQEHNAKVKPPNAA
jgi:LL-H family phage holin